MIETEIKKLTAAIEGLTQALNNSGGSAPSNVVSMDKDAPSTKDEEKLPEAETTTPEPTTEETTAGKADTPSVDVTEDDLKALGMQLLKGKKMKEYSDIIKKFGVSKVSELATEHYEKCHGLLKAEVAKLS